MTSRELLASRSSPLPARRGRARAPCRAEARGARRRCVAPSSTAALAVALAAVALAARSGPSSRDWFVVDAAGGLLVGVIGLVGLASVLVSPAYLATLRRLAAVSGARGGTRTSRCSSRSGRVLLAVPLVGNLGGAVAARRGDDRGVGAARRLQRPAARARGRLEVPDAHVARARRRAARDRHPRRRPRRTAGSRRSPGTPSGRLCRPGATTLRRVRAAARRPRDEDRLGAGAQLAARRAQRGARTDLRAALRGAAADRRARRLALRAGARAVDRRARPARTVLVGFGLAARSPCRSCGARCRGSACSPTRASSTWACIALGIGFGTPLALAGVALHVAGHALAFQGAGNGTPEAIAGSFNANGLGGITGGEEDINNSTAATHSLIQQNGSFYTLGADFRGCLQLTNAAGTTTVFRISVQVGGAEVTTQIVSKGRIVEYDDAIGNGTGSLARAAGILQFQDATSFALSKLLARYAFGLEGVDSTSGHVATGGAFNVSNTTGAISTGFLDSDDAGTLTSNVSGATGAITIPAGSANGRGTFTYMFSSGGVNSQINAAIYMVNASMFFMIDTDAFGTVHTITSGRAIATGNAFTAASLSGNFMLHASGSNVTAGVLTASATLGLLSITPTPGTNTGTVNGTLQSYSSGGQTGVVAQSANGGTYTVSANSGRVTLVIPGLNNPPVLFLATDAAITDHVAVFVVGTDSSALFGASENQPVTVYSINSVITPVGQDDFLGNEDPADNTVTNETGVVAIG